MLIKHAGIHKAPIFLNVRGGSYVRLLPGHEMNIDLHDPFDPFIVGLFKEDYLEGDLKAAQQEMSDSRSDEQREADRHAAAKDASPEIAARHAVHVQKAWTDAGRSVELDIRERAIAEREVMLTEREAAVTKQADTAGNGLGWGPQS